MSNLASRSHEWSEWEIEELLYEVPQSLKPRTQRKTHLRILLRVHWHVLGMHHYILTLKSSPTRVLIDRISQERQVFATAIILARKQKTSHGSYVAIAPEKIDSFLTAF